MDTNSIIKQKFINSFFNQLSDDGLCYAILRNYERLPAHSGDDIDLFIDINDLKDFSDNYLYLKISSLGWKFKVKFIRDDFLSIVCYTDSINSIETLQIDFFVDFQWRGISYIDIPYLIKGIVNYNGFKTVSIGTELAITCIKELLGYGFLRKKHEDKFLRLFNSNKLVFSKSITSQLSDKIFEMFNVSESPNDRRKLLQLKLIFIFNNPSRFLQYSFKLFIYRFSKLFNKKKLIVFIGPDGSGKSTLISNYSNIMDRFYPDNIKFYHRRYNILPELKTSMGLSSMKGKVKPGAKTKIKRSFISVIASYVVVAYYAFDYILGNYYVQKNRLHGSLVLYDRYFYDNYFQPTSRDLIFPFRYLLNLFVAKPTIIVHLKASSNQIYLRKQDLPEREIQIQNDYIDKFLLEYDNVLCLDSVVNDSNQLSKILFHSLINKL